MSKQYARFAAARAALPIVALQATISFAADGSCKGQQSPSNNWVELLGTALTVVNGDAGYVAGNVQCELHRERPIKQYDFCQFCPSRDCQSSISNAGQFAPESFKYRRSVDKGVARWGNSEFAIQNRLRLYSVDTNPAKFGHGLDVILFGGRMELPAQKFSVGWSTPDPSTGKGGISRWTWETLDAYVKFQVQVPLAGPIDFKISAKRGPDDNQRLSDNKATYEQFLQPAHDFVKHDFMRTAGAAEAWVKPPSDVFDRRLSLSNSWALSVVSPPFGAEAIGVVSATLRFGIKGELKGGVEHSEAIAYMSDPNELLLRTYFDDQVSMTPSIKGFLKARIKVPFFTFKKTWQLFDIPSPQINKGPVPATFATQVSGTPDSGLEFGSCTLPGSKKGADQIPCPAGAPAPVRPAFIGNLPATFDDPADPADPFWKWREGMYDLPKKHLSLCRKGNPKAGITTLLTELNTRARKEDWQSKRANQVCDSIKEALRDIEVCDSYVGPDKRRPSVINKEVESKCFKDGTPEPQDSANIPEGL